MNILKYSVTLFALTWLLALSACVTINVYFPASKAEAAADRIVDEILGEPAAKSPQVDDADKGAWLLPSSSSSMLAGFANFWIAPAQASPDFNVNTPEVRRLQSSMANRHSKLASFYDQGVIGFDNNGLVAWRDQSAVSVRERGTLNQLLKDENNDRNSLYQAIARANGQPQWEDDVRSVFAEKWIQKAHSGWWYQSSSGDWKQK